VATGLEINKEAGAGGVGRGMRRVLVPLDIKRKKTVVVVDTRDGLPAENFAIGAGSGAGDRSNTFDSTASEICNAGLNIFLPDRPANE
jgi:hypothetical protein